MGRSQVDGGALSGCGIILVHPKFPENIGVAARNSGEVILFVDEVHIIQL